jgi:hypothetical protein
MNDTERTKLARTRAHAIVEQLRESNKKAARNGAPVVDESMYRGLESTIARKLLRAA